MKKIILGFVMGMILGTGLVLVSAQTATPGRQIARIDKIATQVAALTNIAGIEIPQVNHIPTPVATVIPTPPSF